MVVGVGVMLALPFGVDESGSIATTTDPSDQLVHRVYSVLATQLGERLMRPTYGWDFNSLLFEPLGAINEQIVLKLAQTAMTAWEPGASLVGVRMEQTDESTVRLSIYFRAAGDSSVITGTLSFGTADPSGGVFVEALVDNSSNTTAGGF